MTTITNFTSSGGSSKGTLVVISGVGLTGTKTVYFNGVSATYTVVNDYIIVTVVPPSATTGKIALIAADNSYVESAQNFTVSPSKNMKLQYTQRSAEDIKQQLINIIQNTYPISETWTDYNESDPGVILLHTLAAIGDELNFYLDVQANEAFLPTARQRKNVINLCKLIAYRLDNMVSSEGIVTFRLVGELPTAVSIPKYTRLTTTGGEALPFVTTEAVTISAGSLSVDARVRQGDLYEEEFLVPSEGLIPNQVFVLGRKDIASNEGAIEVFVGQGDTLDSFEQWEEKKTFIIARPEDNQKIFVVDTDTRDNTIIRFGDGKFGAIPSPGFTILVRYLASAGNAGNTGALTISRIEDQLYESGGQPVTVEVFNTQAAVGGADRETIEHAKRQAPQELSALYRGVTKADARALIDGIPGVAKVNVWGEHELPHPDIKHFNQVYVTFLSDGVVPNLVRGPESWLPTDRSKQQVEELMEDRKIITTRIQHINPEVVFVDLELDVFTAPAASAESVKQTVMDAINEYLSIESQDFGKDLRYSNFTKILDSLPGIQYVHLKLKRNGITFYPETGKPLDTISIIGADFSTATAVTFNDIPATFQLMDQGRRIAAVVPYGYTNGPIKVTVAPLGVQKTLTTPYDFGTTVTNTIDRDGADPETDRAQWHFDEQDIIVRRNEIIQLGEIYTPADNSIIPSGIRTMMAKDDEPIRARIDVSPLYARLGEVVTLSGLRSSSPHGNIVRWSWDMGARGRLMVLNTDGTFSESAVQPIDKQRVSTEFVGLNKNTNIPETVHQEFSTVYWVYDERSANGFITMMLTVTDDATPVPNTNTLAKNYEIRIL